jgi:hypothetical protein
MGVGRSEKQRTRRTKAAAQKIVNHDKKVRERARRDARMLARVKEGSLPFNPDVMSWLSARLDKPSTRITQEDIARLTV